MTLAIAGNAASGYNLTKSLRFRSSASAYLQRTPGSASTSAQKFTYSTWVKRGKIGTQSVLLEGGTSANTDILVIGWGAYQDTLVFQAAGTYVIVTSAVYRDVSAWYHICLAVDTTQATASNRVRLYVNGTEVTAYQVDNRSSITTQNYNFSYLNQNGQIQSIGRSYYYGYYWDGYMAETIMVDGQQLTPSSFGSTNALTGVWQPARYTGTYGTNGFYLPFTDVATTSGSNAGLGKDFSGNGNYWTTNNISVTAGTTYDSMTDVPTLTDATTANYCTWNPLNKTSNHTASDGNLTATSSSYGAMAATIGMSSGKWYWEVTCTNRTATNSPSIGYCNELYNVAGAVYLTENSNSGGINSINGNAATNATSTAYGSAISTNDVVMFAFDATNKQMWVGKNGTWFNSGNPVTAANPYPYTITGSTFFPAINCYTDTYVANFGQKAFVYTQPTGFNALNTYNLPTSTIVKGNTVMDATLWTGTGATNSIVNTAPFKPDFVWIKQRSGATWHNLYDSVRGVTKSLASNATDAEDTRATGLTAFNSNGFTVGSDNNANGSSNTYVGWQWQAGQGTTSSNTNGSITSTVSVNASAGFSVVTYTGTGSAATVGHGLGVAPSFIIIKVRSTTNDWPCYHTSLGNTKAQYLNLTSAAAGPNAAYWNNTTPSSSVITLGTSTDLNGNGQTFVAYCWAPIAGFSAFGSYTGNGSADGPFIYTGFRPKFVIARVIDQASFWNLFDSARDPYNVTDHYLYPNSSNAEGSGGNDKMDFLSNGFKIRGTGAGVNSNGSPAIYMAFAENPFKNALAR